MVYMIIKHWTSAFPEVPGPLPWVQILEDFSEWDAGRQ